MNGNIQLHSATSTPTASKSYPLGYSPKEMLSTAVTGLTKGISSFSDDLQSQLVFDELSQPLFEDLVQAGHYSLVQFETADLKFILKEKGRSLAISVNQESTLLENLSLAALRQTFLIDILRNHNRYQPQLVADAIEYVFFDTDNQKLFYIAVRATLHNYLLSLECEITVADYLFRNTELFKIDTLTTISTRVIAGYAKFFKEDPTEHIIHNRDNYCSISVQCASIYIIQNFKNYSDKLLQSALNLIQTRGITYCQTFFAHQASLFIQNNLSFFRTPLHHQARFIHLFRNDMDILEPYSDSLTAILEESDITISVNVKGKRQEMNMLQLWKTGDFYKMALKNIPTLPIFILRNMNCDVFAIWDENKHRRD